MTLRVSKVTTSVVHHWNDLGCLFRGEIRWNEIFKEKMGRKTFLTGVWLEEGEGKKIGRLGCYLPRPTKCFLSKMERKLSGRNLIDKWRKYPCASAHGLVRCLFFWVWFYLYVASSFFSFSFHFSSGLDVAC